MKKLIAVAAVAAAGLFVTKAAAQTAQDELIGAWKISVTIPAGSSACPAGGPACTFQALANVNAEGTAIQTAAVPGTSTGHGVWTKTGDRAFRLRTTYFRFDESGTVIGTAETTSQVTVDASGNQASGTYENRVLDLNGTQTGGFSAPVTGTRIQP